MEYQYKLEMRGITKRFSGVVALSGVDFSVRHGEVHALMGENGAGKSTLMKILSGAYQRDEGEILLDGSPVRIASPRDAIRLGVAVIYQEFMLAPDLSVVENIYIDKLSSGGLFINWRELKEKARSQLARLGFDDIDPGAKVGSLTVAYQQVVEICKCLTRNAQVLVLDEPTAVLTFSEIRKLFEVIQRLRGEGVSIVYISHRLEEIFEITDRITVLKDGGYVGTVNTGDVDKNTLVTMMVGRELTQMFPPRSARIGEAAMEVEHLSAGSMVKDVSFVVRAGEVLGFSGLVGAGRSEAMRAIFGVDPRSGGSTALLGKPVRFRSSKQAIRSGLGMLPEDRKKQGLLLEQSIRMNTTLAALGKVTRLGFIRHRREKQLVRELLETLSTKHSGLDRPVNSLSGGNQQKISLAKWMMADCRCIVFDEPTRGVDVGAKTEIYKIINGLAEQGVAVILISSDMPEIIGMCDRVVVMRQGLVAGELERDAINEQSLIKLSMGVE